MYPSPSIASEFNRRVAELVHYFLGVALRHIGDRLLRILMAMLRHRTCYDASRMRREPVVQMG